MVADASLIACERRVIKAQIDHQIICAVIRKGRGEKESHPTRGNNAFVVLIDRSPVSAFPGGFEVLRERRMLKTDGPVGKRLRRRGGDEQREPAQVARAA